MNWYDFPICVPFGNPNFDVQYGGAHDMDVQTPPNTPITALVDGMVTDVSAPIWGKQVCLQIHGFAAPYMAYLHLSAVNPALHPGVAVKEGDIIGWSGGCTDASQYGKTTNPTGENFLNASSQSSQPQTGIALMHGPVYGSGPGWTQFPPVDGNLNPLPLIQYARSHESAAVDTAHRQAAMLNAMWQMIVQGLRYPTGIYQDWYEQAVKGVFYGPAISGEIQGETWEGVKCIRQFFTGGYVEDINGVHHWYRYA